MPENVRATGLRPTLGRVSRRALVIAATVGLTSASVAIAAWTANGNGNGQGKSQARQAVTVAAGTASADLFPGANGDVVVKITNPNPYKVRLSSVATNGSITATNVSCNVAAVSFRFASLGITDAIAPGAEYTLTIVNGLTMSNAANDDCANTSFTVPLMVAAASDPSAASTATSGTVTAP